MLGQRAASRMLKEGWKPTAAEAAEIGLVKEVVDHGRLLARAQELGEQWVAEGKKKEIPGGGTVEEYKAVNARESLELADAFLSYNFLNVSRASSPPVSFNCFLQAQYEFLKSKGKSSQANVFLLIKSLRPLWSKLL